MRYRMRTTTILLQNRTSIVHDARLDPTTSYVLVTKPTDASISAHSSVIASSESDARKFATAASDPIVRTLAYNPLRILPPHHLSQHPLRQHSHLIHVLRHLPIARLRFLEAPQCVSYDFRPVDDHLGRAVMRSRHGESRHAAHREFAWKMNGLQAWARHEKVVSWLLRAII